MLKNLKTLGKEDIWIYLGHTAINKEGQVIGLVEHDGWSPDDPVEIEKFGRALEKRSNKKYQTGPGPAIVVLAGCRSCELADKFIAKGVRYVVCANGPIAPKDSEKMIRTFLTGLCQKGQSVQGAFESARDEYAGRELQNHAADRVSMDSSIDLKVKQAPAK